MCDCCHKKLLKCIIELDNEGLDVNSLSSHVIITCILISFYVHCTAVTVSSLTAILFYSTSLHSATIMMANKAVYNRFRR